MPRRRPQSIIDLIPEEHLTDRRPFWRRYDAAEGLSLHDASIFYGPDFEVEMVWTLTREGYDGPSPLEVWSDPEELRDFNLKSFQLDQRRRILRQLLLQKLTSGELFATGFSSSSPLDQDATRIAPSRWRVLRPDFEHSRARGLGVVIEGILVFSRPPAPKAAEPAGRYSQAELRRWYEGWVKSNVDTGNMPSRQDDLAAARKVLGPNIPRDAPRSLRRELAPPEWNRFGRRKAK